MPNGAMVGTISLSPRANWRMPSDSDFREFLDDIQSYKSSIKNKIIE